MISRLIGILLCWFLLATVAYAEQIPEADDDGVKSDTQEVDTDDEAAKAEEAMTVGPEDEPEDAASEALETEQVLQRVLTVEFILVVDDMFQCRHLRL